MKKNFLALLLAAMTATFVFTACGKAEEKENDETQPTQEQTIDENDDLQDEFIPTVDYSQNFSIETISNGIKKVVDGEGRELILIDKSIETIPDEYSTSTVIRTPISKAIMLSDTNVCSLRAAGDDSIFDSVVGLSTDKDMWYVDEVKTRMENGSIAYVGGSMTDPDYELITSLSPDLVFVYTGEFGQQAIIEKLEELDINYAVNNDYWENDYLSRTEWLKFVLTFFNQDENADAYMKNVISDFETISEKVADLEKKEAAIFNIYEGSVYGTSSGTWSGKLLESVGGINAFAEDGFDTLSVEALFDRVIDSDVIVYSLTESWCPGIDSILEQFPLLTDCEAYKNDNIYVYSDSYWQSNDEIHILGKELASLLNPDLKEDLGVGEYKYFKKLQLK